MYPMILRLSPDFAKWTGSFLIQQIQVFHALFLLFFNIRIELCGDIDVFMAENAADQVNIISFRIQGRTVTAP